MKCIKCGFELEDTYKYCIKCGTPRSKSIFKELSTSIVENSPAAGTMSANEQPGEDSPADETLTAQTLSDGKNLIKEEAESRPEEIMVSSASIIESGDEEHPASLLIPITPGTFAAGESTFETTVNLKPEQETPVYGKLIVELKLSPEILALFNRASNMVKEQSADAERIKEDSKKEDPTRNLITRVFLFLEDEEFEKAQEYCERVLDMQPYHALAYLGKLLADLKLTNVKQLPQVGEFLEENRNFKKCLRYGDDVLVNMLKAAVSKGKSGRSMSGFSGKNGKYMPLVSVVVPVFNGEEKLKKCLDSLCNQTLRDIEIIIVNDGSEDRSQEIINAYVVKDRRIFLLTQDHTGVSAARNHALRYCNGQYITFVDADDWLELNALEKAWELVKQHDPDILMWNEIFEYPDQDKIIPFQEAEHLISGQNEMEEWHWRMFTEYAPNGKREFGTRCVHSKMIRRKLIVQSRLCFDEKLRQHEDTMFMFEAYELAKSAYMTNEGWYHRHIEQGSAAGRYAPDIVQNNAQAAFHMNQLLEKYGKEEHYYDFFKSVLVNWMIQDFDLYIFHEENPMSDRERYKEAEKILRSEPYVSAFRKIPKGKRILRSKRVCMFLAKHQWTHLLTAYFKMKSGQILKDQMMPDDM